MMIRYSLLFITMVIGLINCKASDNQSFDGVRKYMMLGNEKISEECRAFIKETLDPFLEKIINKNYSALQLLMRTDGKGFGNSSDFGGYKFMNGSVDAVNRYKWKSFMMELTNHKLWGDGETLRTALIKATNLAINGHEDLDYKLFSVVISGEKEYVLQFMYESNRYFFATYYVARRINGMADMIYRNDDKILPMR